MGCYTNWIMDLLSKDNDKYRKENEALKDMINKFISGKYTKEKLIQEYELLINKEKKS
jgi:hypothetical protein